MLPRTGRKATDGWAQGSDVGTLGDLLVGLWVCVLRVEARPWAQREDGGPGVDPPPGGVGGEWVASSKGLLEVRVRV